MLKYRILDAEVNRVSEGFRCLEDIFRFYYEDKNLCKECKELRHIVRKAIPETIQDLMLKSRNVSTDHGFDISQKCDVDNKTNKKQLVTANFKRIQEGLRSIEEITKIINEDKISKQYEWIRFKSYDLEQQSSIRQLKFKKKNPLDYNLYCLTGEKFSKGRNNIQIVSVMIDAGIQIIQYREKEKTLLEKYNQCKVIRELTKKNDVTFIINDDISLAQIIDADGVHVGQDDLPAKEVRKILGECKIIGVSTHSPEQALAAVEAEADYIGVGPIYPTETKENVCAAVGLEYLDWVVKNIDIPFVAIGGIKKHNLPVVIEHGAKCIAMVTEILETENIPKEIRQITNIIDQYKKEN